MHIKQAHDSKTYLIKHNVGPESNLERVQMWSEEIMLYKQGKCFIDGCQFVDNYVKILEKHYAHCVCIVMLIKFIFILYYKT